jgi:hypothetical protein
MGRRGLASLPYPLNRSECGDTVLAASGVARTDCLHPAGGEECRAFRMGRRGPPAYGRQGASKVTWLRNVLSDPRCSLATSPAEEEEKAKSKPCSRCNEIVFPTHCYYKRTQELGDHESPTRLIKNRMCGIAYITVLAQMGSSGGTSTYALTVRTRKRFRLKKYGSLAVALHNGTRRAQ